MSKVRAEQYTNRLGTGAPEIPYGVTVPEGASIDGAGGLNLTGIATAGTFKGSIDATTASFSGNVSIAGTLTYEDVTNIDSVGLITARSGIEITGNIGLGGATYGTAGQVLTSGGSGANATWVDAGGGSEYSGIASGSITAGRAVTVADDGKLLQVTGSNKLNGTSATAVVNNNCAFSAVIYDTTNNKYVLFFVEGGVGKARVGTPSGTTVSWGTSVQFAGSVPNNSQGLFDACYDPHNNKCIVLFRNSGNSNRGSVCSGTVSGTSITMGSPVVVCSDVMESGTITYCPNANHNYVIAGNDGSNSRFISNVGYNSGTNSSTWDNNVNVVNSSQAFAVGSCWDAAAQKVVVVWANMSSGNSGQIVAGTIASNAVTWGTIYEYDSTDTSVQNNVVHHAASGKNVIVWAEASGNGHAFACTATLTGTDFAFGSHTTISKNALGASVESKDIGAIYDPSAKKVLAAFHDSSSGIDDGLSVIITVTGTDVSSTNGYTFQTLPGVESGNVSMAHDSDLERNIVTTWDTNNIRYYVEKLMNTTVDETNFVGISQASYTNGQTAKISLTGAVNEAVSGLAPANKYYVLADGSLGTDSSMTGINAGLALASDKLYIRGW